MAWTVNRKMGGTWERSFVAFQTMEEANAYARHCFENWKGIEDAKPLEVPGQAPTYSYTDGVLTRLQKPAIIQL